MKLRSAPFAVPPTANKNKKKKSNKAVRRIWDRGAAARFVAKIRRRGFERDGPGFAAKPPLLRPPPHHPLLLLAPPRQGRLSSFSAALRSTPRALPRRRSPWRSWTRAPSRTSSSSSPCSIPPTSSRCSASPPTAIAAVLVLPSFPWLPLTTTLPFFGSEISRCKVVAREGEEVWRWEIEGWRLGGLIGGWGGIEHGSLLPHLRLPASSSSHFCFGCCK